MLSRVSVISVVISDSSECLILVTGVLLGPPTAQDAARRRTGTRPPLRDVLLRCAVDDVDDEQGVTVHEGSRQSSDVYRRLKAQAPHKTRVYNAARNSKFVTCDRAVAGLFRLPRRARPREQTVFGAVAVAGVGATEFSKESGKSELALAVEAVKGALADAGLVPADVDGLVTFDLDDNPEISVANALGIPELTYFSRTPYGGGGACATVLHAAMAVHLGLARTVVCYRAFNERSGQRFAFGVKPAATTAAVDWTYARTAGLVTAASKVAVVSRRYMHEYGATSEDFGRVSVAMRRHASTNPKAWFYRKPITLADHQASRLIADPLRLLDCCQESDGGVAIVVTSLERARDLARPPAVIVGGAQASVVGQEVGASYGRRTISALPEMGLAARQLWGRSGLATDDVQVAVMYDHFTPYILMQLEELGFCGRGEGKDFVADGGIELDGKLPVNPHGGQLGEAYIHGMNGVAEAARQIRGDAVNQVGGATTALVTAGTGVPTSVLLFQGDR
jgi:acetyl-CoA acetyltransferase